MKRYPRWKVGLLVAVLLFCGVYALPNLYPNAPAVQISAADAGDKVPDSLTQKLLSELEQAGVTVTGTARVDNSWLVKLESSDDQLKAKEVFAETLSDAYVLALNSVATTPEWLRAIGAKPMDLGLDLQGGVHFLLQVDMKVAVEQRLEANAGELKMLLRDASVRYRSVTLGDKQLTVAFTSAEALEQGEDIIEKRFREYQIHESRDLDNALLLTLTPASLADIKNQAIAQNRTALNNRVNGLGVSNAVVRRQGANRIVVELPGVKNAAKARRILGKTATLEFRLVKQGVSPARLATGIAPPGSEIFPFKDTERNVALKTQKIVTGAHVVSARAGRDQQNGRPEVNITLDSAGARSMLRVTSDHVGDPMAVLFIEVKTEKKTVRGEGGKPEVQYVSHQEAKVINVATIQDALGSRFRITGLDSMPEARELALLLNAGSLAAPMYVVGQSTIGATLGEENIKAGMISMLSGLLLILVFMTLYYKGAGLIACIALIGNMIVLVGVMSLVPGATLTLAGIAGIVLTMGMAVDANVLIYEQIKQSMKEGLKPLQALEHGFDRAFVTIVDANLTTVIAAVVLLAMGASTVKGFAITLIIGIGASMFTAIIGSRAILEMIYARPGRKAPTRLSI